MFAIKYARQEADGFAVKLYAGESLRESNECLLQLVPYEALDDESIDLLEQYTFDCKAFNAKEMRFYPLQVEGNIELGPMTTKEWTDKTGAARVSDVYEWFEHGVLTVSRFQEPARESRFIAAI